MSTFDRLRLLLVLVAAPVVVLGILRVRVDIGNVYDWLPDASPERDAYEWFGRRFGSDDFLLVAWPGSTLDDERIPAFTRELKRTGADALFRTIDDGPQALARLIEPPAELTLEDASERLRGVYLGPDGETTCVLIRLTAVGQRNRREAISGVYRAADAVDGLSADELIMGGNPYLSYMGDRETRRALLWCTPPACLVGALLAFLCLRDWRTLSIVVVGAAAATAAAVSLVGWRNDTLDGLLAIMPTMVFVLSMSGALHIVNYFRTAAEAAEVDPVHRTSSSDDGVDAVQRTRMSVVPSRDSLSQRTLATAWKPCTISAVTTAIGMASLLTSEFPAVRRFGLYSACGVMLSLAVLLCWTPAALARWAPASRRRPRYQGLRAIGAGILGFAVRRHRMVLMLSASAVVLLPLPLSRLRASLNLEQFFYYQSDYLQHARWIEQNIGPIETTELVLRFNREDEQMLGERIDLVRRVQKKLESLPIVESATSQADFLPDPPELVGLAGGMRRRLYRHRLNQARDRWVDGLYVSETGDEQLWRITLRFNTLDDVDYDRLERDAVQTATETLASDSADDVSVMYTGVSHLFYEAQRKVVWNLAESFLLAFAAITPVLMVALGSLRGGLAAMLPNVLPVLLVFGGMGLLEIRLDQAVMVTAVVALGIAVDDTTHFVVRYSSLVRSGVEHSMALRGAYHECSAAMTQTTLVCGTAMLVFVFSPLATLGRFAVTIALILTAALVGDLVVLPAMIASRLSGWFGRRAP